MRRVFLLLLLLAPAAALNLTVDCSGPCLAHLPAAGYAVLNYSVNGSQLGGIFRSAHGFNVSGDIAAAGRLNSLVKLNMTRRSCEAPATAFQGLNALETAQLDDWLLIRANLTQSNATLKLFCGGYNTLQENADWFGSVGVPRHSSQNITFNGSRTMLSGLEFGNSVKFDLNDTHGIEISRGNWTVANVSSVLNLTLWYQDSLLDYLELPKASHVYMDHGNVTQLGEVYVVSHGAGGLGNVTLLNGTFDINATLQFNRTGGVAVADVNNDSLREVVACANTTGDNYNLTVIHWSTGGWDYYQTGISCPMTNPFGSFDPFTHKGINESIITFNSTSLVLLKFNETAEAESDNMPDIFDLATFDADGDGDSEVAVAFNDGRVNLYNVTLASGSIQTQLIDRLGDWKNAHLDTHPDRASPGPNLLAVENGTLGIYLRNGVLTTNASTSYHFPQSVPLKLVLNVTRGGPGTATLNVTSGGWFWNATNLTTGNTIRTLYPEANETLWINFTLGALNSTHEPWVEVNSLALSYANSTRVNYTNHTIHAPVSFPINTTLTADGNFTLVGAAFRGPFTLDYFTAFLPAAGSYNFDLNGTLHQPDLWKAVAGFTRYNRTWPSTPAVQGSQGEGNFSAVATFNDTLVLVEEGVSVSAHGAMEDSCSLGTHVVYTWGNATALQWDGSSLAEVGNYEDHGFTGCWLNGSSAYLVNSTGGVEIFNFTLSRTGGFSNSSFTATDVMVNDRLYVLNGTHVASANATNNRFTVLQEWEGEIFQAGLKYHNITSFRAVETPTGDVNGDSLWEQFTRGVFSIVDSVARLLQLPAGSYSSFGSNVSVAFDNGTIHTFKLDLTTPSVGSFISFTANVTSTQDWVAVNSSHTFLVNFSVSGFPRNETDTLADFWLRCENGTHSSEWKADKYDNHSFSTPGKFAAGRHDCSIYPQWELPLPLTFSDRDFTLYSDSGRPNVTSITTPDAVSSLLPFNVTVNVTEDAGVRDFYAFVVRNGSLLSGYTASVQSHNLLSSSGGYQLYNLTIVVDYSGTGTPVAQLNISAVDYLGSSSANHTTGNLTIYDQNPPTIRVVDSSPSNNIQDFAYVPLNMSFICEPFDNNGDANISFVNVTVWQGSALQASNGSAGLNKGIHTAKINTFLTANGDEYVVRVEARDVTGNSREASMNVSRYPAEDYLLTVKWTDDSGDTTFNWQNSMERGEGLRSGQTITDTLSATNTTTGDTTINLTAPAVVKSVEEWYIKNEASGGLDYIQFFYYDQPLIENIKQYVNANGNEWGVNMSAGYDPDTVKVHGARDVGTGQRMCLEVCNNYNLDAGSCDGSWTEEDCGGTGNDAWPFNLLGGDVPGNLDDGVGFKITVETVEETTTDEETETTTTTTDTGSAVITITAPSSKTTEVGECVDVTFTIENAGTASDALTDLTASGFTEDDMTFTILTDITFPNILSPGEELEAILSFCPLKADVHRPSVCIELGSDSECTSIPITATGEDVEVPEELEMSLSVEQFEDEYIVLVNSTAGPLEGATVTITYPDGSQENFTTNVFGKVNFVPKLKEFTVKAVYGEDSMEEDVEDLQERVGPQGLTMLRILLDLLIVGVLLGFGIILDEKML